MRILERQGHSLPFSFLYALVVLSFAATTPALAQKKPAVVELKAGMHLIQAEVVSDPGSRAQGLMHRRTLAPNAGMLFIFDEPAIHCMWMKNTFVPLSVAFIDERGTIANIADMEPHSEVSHCAARPVRYALEMNRGWFAARSIKPGSRLGGIPGTN